jgi:hypothetical protein
MSGMIKPDAETPQRRKRSHRPRFRIGVTDNADRAFIIGKLLAVTADTRHMLRFAGKTHARGIVIPAMTDQTINLRMILVIMRKFGRLDRFRRRICQSFIRIGRGICRVNRRSFGNRNELRRIAFGLFDRRGTGAQEELQKKNRTADQDDGIDPTP